MRPALPAPCARQFPGRIDEIEELLTGSRIWKQRLVDIGTVTAAVRRRACAAAQGTRHTAACSLSITRGAAIRCPRASLCA